MQPLLKCTGQPQHRPIRVSHHQGSSDAIAVDTEAAEPACLHSLLGRCPGGGQALRCDTDGSGAPDDSRHRAGWGQRGPRLRASGRGRPEAVWDRQRLGGCLAHPGVRLQQAPQAEHRAVPRGRRLRGQVEVHREHCRWVSTSVSSQPRRGHCGRQIQSECVCAPSCRYRSQSSHSSWEPRE